MFFTHNGKNKFINDISIIQSIDSKSECPLCRAKTF